MNRLKEYIRDILSEKSLREMSLDRLGLVISRPNEWTTYFVLHDTSLLLKQSVPWWETPSTSISPPPGLIQGFISIKEIEQFHGECHGAMQVTASAAEKGLGPALYDIALFYANKMGKPLAADRGSVSQAARHVWYFYHWKRDDVEYLPFDDKDDPKTPDPSDDCQVHGYNPIDSAYTAIDAGIKGKIDAMLQRSDDAIQKWMKENPDLTPGGAEVSLRKWGLGYFFLKYN